MLGERELSQLQRNVGRNYGCFLGFQNAIPAIFQPGVWSERFRLYTHLTHNTHSLTPKTVSLDVKQTPFKKRTLGGRELMATMYVPETRRRRRRVRNSVFKKNSSTKNQKYLVQQYFMLKLTVIHKEPLYANARKIMACHYELHNCFEYLNSRILVIQLHSTMTQV